ncbi:DUF1257 domain-containing protein [Paenibacillus sp. UNC451MF]|uniref:DUF1257 domain-containing protein n=1 Tax=Paenibacillus sp. UNC451MF TaxID=1449063 RepID=UPI00048BE263|nr:DUF1257 domain-containing protein [Paenibacillus sp. UNC451MF]
MSHFTKMKTEIRDIQALEFACRELGLDLLKDYPARGYTGKLLSADYVIKLKGPYDIALSLGRTNTYTLTTDWYNGHVEKEVGKRAERLLQHYAVHAATLAARKQGYAVERRQMEDGSIKLICRVGG